MNISSQSFPPIGSNSSHLIIFSFTGLDINSLVLSATLIITILFGFPTNSYAIWLIVRGTGNGLWTEFFTLNLSVCEMLLCAESLLALFTSKCKVLTIIVNFIDGFIVNGRAQFQCLMCVERYLAVLHPVTFLKYKPLRYRVICSVIVWMSGFISCGVSVMAVFWEVTEIYFAYLFTQFLLFIFIQLFCLVAVLRALKQAGPGERKREKEENQMKRRVFYLILITTVMMLILYIPYIILIVPQWVSEEYTTILYSVGYISFSFAGLVQPLLFLYRVGKLPFMKFL